MAAASSVRISSPCVRGNHDGCLAPSSCECRCHRGGLEVVEEPAVVADAVPAPVPAVPAAAVAPAPAAPPAPVEHDDDPKVGGLVFEWEEPPRRYGPRRAPELLTDEQEQRLRSNPGKWARVREFKGPTGAHQYRKRWIDRCAHADRAAERFPSSEWDVEARKFPNGQSAVWVRYWPPSARDNDA